MPVSIRDVAQRAGVSPATVSLVLGGKAQRYRISAPTAERVRTIADDMAYRPNVHARRLRGRTATCFGLVVPDLGNHFFALLAKSCERLAREAGQQLWIVDSDGDAAAERRQIASLVQRGVDGLLVASSDPDLVQPADIPAVTIDRDAGHRPAQVGSDNRTAMRTLVASLLADGHLRASGTLWIGGDIGVSSTLERWHGFAEALIAAGEDPQRVARHDGHFGADWAEAVLRGLSQPPRAIITASYTLFEGVLRARRQGLVPTGCTLATFDDHPALDWLDVPVSSARQDHEGLAAAAWAELQRQVQGGRAPKQPIRVAATIINRFQETP